MACGAGQVVTFNYAAWVARFPEFSAVPQTVVQSIFDNEAGLYCNNTPSSFVQDIPTRTTALNYILAHIIALNPSLNPAGNTAGSSSPLVGRITSAHAGSVSVNAEMKGPDAAAWFNQTQYGAAFWQLMAQYRTMIYIPGAIPGPPTPRIYNRFGWS